MKDTPKSGLETEFRFRVTDAKTVPALYPEAPEFQAMPQVFATGSLVGFNEWACIKLVNPHLDWPREQTAGTHVNISHTAATPPGMHVTAHVKIVAIEGRRPVFDAEAPGETEPVGKGRHERHVIDRKRFDEKMIRKKAADAEGQ